MTEVRMTITREDGPLWFDCRGHAGDREVCGMISTVLNFLVIYMSDQGIVPKIYDKGHLQFEIYASNLHINRVFRAVETTLKQLEIYYPENIKVY